MKRRHLSWIVLVGLLFGAGPAGSFELTLDTRLNGALGYDSPPILLDVYLDSQGEKGITSFSVSLRYDASQLTYRPDLSSAADSYPLYAYAVIGVKAVPSHPATWLVPVSNPPRFSTPQYPYFTAGQVSLEFVVNTGLNSWALGTATNLYLGTIAFEVPAGDFFSPLIWGGGEGDHFMINGDGTTVTPITTILGDNWVAIVPEPATALLVAAGLAVVGLRRRRRG